MNEERILNWMLEEVLFHKYDDETLLLAANSLNISRAGLYCIFPEGILSFTEYVLKKINDDFCSILSNSRQEHSRVSERIVYALETKLQVLDAYKTIIVEVVGYYCVHPYQSSKLLWRLSDHIWTWVGDKSTDFNYYSKRVTLSQIILKMVLFFVQDRSPDHMESVDFMKREILRLKFIMDIKNYCSIKKIPILRYLLAGKF